MSSDENKNSDNIDDVALFTYEEMRDFVRGFLIAYADNKIQVDFLKHAPFTIDKNGVKLYSATDAEMADKCGAGLQEEINISIKAKEATNDERRQVIKDLFSNIFAYRMNGWIEGSFYDFSLERRLVELEKKYNKHDKTINEYVEHLKEQSGV
ncbi:MAG: hypothetical protein QW303_09260 [Nitrososphaerota archaeon]